MRKSVVEKYSKLKHLMLLKIAKIEVEANAEFS